MSITCCVGVFSAAAGGVTGSTIISRSFVSCVSLSMASWLFFASLAGIVSLRPLLVRTDHTPSGFFTLWTLPSASSAPVSGVTSLSFGAVESFVSAAPEVGEGTPPAASAEGVAPTGPAGCGDGCSLASARWRWFGFLSLPLLTIDASLDIGTFIAGR